MPMAEIGFDGDNRIVALKVSAYADLGAYVSPKSGWAIGNIGGVAGVYQIPTIRAEVFGIFTHASPTAAYRGAGRPEATYMIERVLDVAARELGISPFELRRRNLIPLPRCRTRPRWCSITIAASSKPTWTPRQVLPILPASRPAGRKPRVKASCAASASATASRSPAVRSILAPDTAQVSLLADGRLRVHTGSMSVGQGHETTFPRMIAERSACPRTFDYLHATPTCFPSAAAMAGRARFPRRPRGHPATRRSPAG